MLMFLTTRFHNVGVRSLHTNLNFIIDLPQLRPKISLKRIRVIASKTKYVFIPGGVYLNISKDEIKINNMIE